jgi:phage terminase Nu1 subunit (DNA packaging protein)
VHLQSAEYWGHKAARARHAAAMLVGANAKATLLEMAVHYENLARRARMIAAILDEAPNLPERPSIPTEC